MEVLVHKSKGFLHRYLSNSIGESFNVEGIGCRGGGRSKAASLKEKLVGGFS